MRRGRKREYGTENVYRVEKICGIEKVCRTERGFGMEHVCRTKKVHRIEIIQLYGTSENEMQLQGESGNGARDYV